MQKLLYLSAFTFILCFIACSGEKKKENVLVHPRFDSQMARTAQDSADVLNLTNRYLGLLKSGQFDEALSMLYTYNSEDSIVQPISEDRRQELLSTFSTFPVLKFEIDTVLMYNEFDTEVRYIYEFFKKPEGSTMPNTVSGSVCPHRIEGQWYLVVPAEKSEVWNIVHRTKY
jgi:hypothetical protein